jgi:branched-subunit amino acid ABC-type transport system permease component
MATSNLPRAATLRIIRVALLTGVLMFGGIAFYLTRQRGGGIGEPDVAPTLKWVNIGFLIVAAIGIMIMQRKHAAEGDPARRSTLNIVAWALGEATALFGGVHFLLVGDPAPYLVGLGLMLASFVAVPIRE